MKTFSNLLFFFATINSTFSTPITALIVFENNTDQTNISCQFYIAETNQRIPFNSLDSFTSELPKNGTYHFRFYADDIDASTIYPVRLTGRKHTVIIRLENKTEAVVSNPTAKHFPMKGICNYSKEQLEQSIKLCTINFIIHGLVAINPETVDILKTAYGVGFTSENCVVNPMWFKIAMQTNKKIEAYLISLFGKDWKNKLPATPFGLQLDRF